METIIGEVDMDFTEIYLIIMPDIPPWTIRTPNMNLTLRKIYKNKINQLIFKEELEKVMEEYPKNKCIFMDWFKLEKITGLPQHIKEFFF